LTTCLVRILATCSLGTEVDSCPDTWKGKCLGSISDNNLSSDFYYYDWTDIELSVYKSSCSKKSKTWTDA